MREWRPSTLRRRVVLPGSGRRWCIVNPATEPSSRVMFQGDEVAAMAADTEEQAIDAARLVKVDYEVLPHLTNVARR